MVVHDPDSGVGQVVPSARDLMLEGAVLIELAEAGCAEVFEKPGLLGGRRVMVRLSHPQEPLDPLLATALANGRPGTKPRGCLGVLDRLGKLLMPQLRQCLVQRGLWEERRQRRLLFFEVITYPAAHEHARHLRHRLRAVLLDGDQPTPRERSLILLLSARKQLPIVVGRPNRKAATARAQAFILDADPSSLVHREVRARSLRITPHYG